MSKKKKQIKSQIERSSYWQLLLQKVDYSTNIRDYVKKNLPTHLIEEIIGWLRTNEYLYKKFFGFDFPFKIEEWQTEIFTSYTSISREILFCYLRIKPHFLKIKEFVNLAENYEIVFIRSDFEKCSTILKVIEEKFGLSLWLIKRRIHLLQLVKGIETQKEYSNKLKNDPNFKYRIIPYLIHYISNRSEIIVNPKSFHDNFYKSILSMNIPDFLKSYILYHILSTCTDNINLLPSILNFESTTSLIDYYEALVTTFQMYAAIKESTLEKSLQHVLNEICIQTNDIRLQRVKLQFDESFIKIIDSNIFKNTLLYHSFVKGDNEKTIQLCIVSSFNQTGIFAC